MKEWRTPHFAICIIAIGIFAWAFYRNPADQTLIGAIIGAFNMAVGYWLGSSSGSARKTDLLADEGKGAE